MAFDANDPEDQKILQDAIAKAMEGAEAKKTELLGETKAEREKRRGLEDQLEKLKDSVDGVDVEEYQKLKKAQLEEENRKAEEKGEFEKLKIQLAEKSAAETKAEKDRADGLEARLHSETKTTQILSALAKEKGNPALLTHVVNERIRVEDVDGKLTVVGLDDRGEVMLGEDGKPATVVDVVKHLKTKEEYWGAFDGVDMRGSGSHPSKGIKPGMSNPWKKDAFNLTEQGRISQSDAVLASQLKKEAGVG